MIFFVCLLVCVAYGCCSYLSFGWLVGLVEWGGGEEQRRPRKDKAFYTCWGVVVFFWRLVSLVCLFFITARTSFFMFNTTQTHTQSHTYNHK
jgi:prepilin signal peptidase PulO-like enzyme (type II secretory pathway)